MVRVKAVAAVDCICAIVCTQTRTSYSPCSKSPNGAKLPLVDSQSLCVRLYARYTCDNTCYPVCAYIAYITYVYGTCMYTLAYIDPTCMNTERQRETRIER